MPSEICLKVVSLDLRTALINVGITYCIVERGSIRNEFLALPENFVFVYTIDDCYMHYFQ